MALVHHEHVLTLFPNLCPALLMAYPIHPPTSVSVLLPIPEPCLGLCCAESRPYLLAALCRWRMSFSSTSIFCWPTRRTWWPSSEFPSSKLPSWSTRFCSWTRVDPHSCRKLHTCVVHTSCVSFSFFRASSCSRLGRGGTGLSQGCHVTGTPLHPTWGLGQGSRDKSWPAGHPHTLSSHP